jgi:hypothetical protein
MHWNRQKQLAESQLLKGSMMRELCFRLSPKRRLQELQLWLQSRQQEGPLILTLFGRDLRERVARVFLALVA